VNVLAHNLAEPAYEADVAQLEYKLVAGEHGLVVRLKGFNHKLPVRRISVTFPSFIMYYLTPPVLNQKCNNYDPNLLSNRGYNCKLRISSTSPHVIAG